MILWFPHLQAVKKSCSDATLVVTSRHRKFENPVRDATTKYTLPKLLHAQGH